MTAEAIIAGLTQKTLLAGTYKVEGALNFTGLTDVILDGSNIKLELDKTITFENCNNVTLKNISIFTSNNATPVIDIKSSCKNINFTKIEFTSSDVLNGSMATIMKAAALVIVNGCRFDSGNSYNGILLEEGAKGSTIKNCAISSGNIAVIDHSKDGILIENNFINTVNGVQSDSAYTSVSYNTINVTDTAIAFNDGGLHLLASLNVINGAGKHAVVNNAKNVVFIKNKLGSIEANSVHLMTVAMNEFTKPEKNVTLTDCQYVLVDDNTGISLDKKTGCTNVYGDDALDQTARVEYGVNEDLLPKLDKEFFVGMKRRDTVNYGGTEMTLNDYIDLMAVQSEYVIIPPGAYSLDTIHLTKVKNLSIYAYGVMAEYYSYKNPAMIAGNCDTVILKGITIDHADIANAQGTVVDKTDKYLVWKSDEGYLADLTDMNYFPEQAWGARFLKGSDIPCADIDFQKKEKDSDGNIRLYYGNGNSRNVLVGDKIVMRGLMQQISDVWSSSNMQYEDVSIYNGTKFAFSERGNGEKATRMNRVAVTPGPAPILKDQNGNFRTNADGSYVRGVPRMASTADATHSTNMQKGPITTNSVFEKMTDDGTNINGEFSKVTNYDPETNTLTYKYGDNAYSGICANFKVGDKVLIFTRRGKLLIDTVATSETSMTPDYVYSVQLKDDVVLENGSLLQNASASGNDFVFDNCKVDNVRSRGLLIKASKGIIKNCTLTNTGMSGILVKPEIDEPWNECGYADGLIIENNFLKNNGILTGSDLHSPINITGDGQNKSDPLYQMHKNISVKNNKIEDRNTQYAIHVNSLQASEIKNNDLGTRKGYTMQTDTNPGIYLNGDSSIVVSNNIYPEKADPKVETSNTAKDITGNDVGSLIASMLETKVESVLVNNQWKIQVVMKNLTTHPISGVIAIDKATVGMVNLKDTITINKLAANETITKYIDIICPPSQLNPRQGVGNIALKVKLDDGTVGKITTKLSFDIAVKAENAPVITGTTIDPVWEKAPKTYLGKENADPSAEIKFLWDQEYLYFYTSVQDAEHYQASCADMMWMNDCVQLAIDPSRSIESGINGQAELGFALNSQTNKVMAYAWINTISGKTGILNITTDVEANVFRDEAHKNTVYQAKIPWSMIGADGKCPELNKEIGFNVALTDYDKSVELTTSIQLYGGTQGSKDPGLFGAMRLFETAPNPPVGPTPLPDVKPTPEPVQPPTVTQSVDDKGTIKLQIEAPDISEVVTTLDKTIVKNEVTIDETIIAKATEKTPITIDMKLSTENTKKVIENSLTQKVEIKLVVPNALFSNQYVSISSLTISKEVFEQAKISKKNVAFIVETIDGTIIAAFAFEGAEIAHIVDTNLAVNLFPAHKDKAGVNKNGVTLSFVHSGKLPSKATVTLNVSKYYPNGTELFLYYENKETGKMDFVASGIKVIEGKALIGIEHCSNYMITDTAIATDVPKTADTTTIYFTIAFSFLMLAACLGFIRRTILNKEFSHQ
ncbi:MAG: sugar-binding protein [Oscillospiraceae bacterium]